MASYKPKMNKRCFAHLQIQGTINAINRKQHRYVEVYSPTKETVYIVDQIIRESRRCKTQRWLLCIFSNMLNVVLNAYAIYNHIIVNNSEKPPSRQAYIMRISE